MKKSILSVASVAMLAGQLLGAPATFASTIDADGAEYWYNPENAAFSKEIDAKIDAACTPYISDAYYSNCSAFRRIEYMEEYGYRFSAVVQLNVDTITLTSINPSRNTFYLYFSGQNKTSKIKNAKLDELYVYWVDDDMVAPYLAVFAQEYTEIIRNGAAEESGIHLLINQPAPDADGHRQLSTREETRFVIPDGKDNLINNTKNALYYSYVDSYGNSSYGTLNYTPCVSLEAYGDGLGVECVSGFRFINSTYGAFFVPSEEREIDKDLPLITPEETLSDDYFEEEIEPGWPFDFGLDDGEWIDEPVFDEPAPVSDEPYEPISEDSESYEPISGDNESSGPVSDDDNISELNPDDAYAFDPTLDESNIDDEPVQDQISEESPEEDLIVDTTDTSATNELATSGLSDTDATIDDSDIDDFATEPNADTDILDDIGATNDENVTSIETPAAVETLTDTPAVTPSDMSEASDLPPVSQPTSIVTTNNDNDTLLKDISLLAIAASTDSNSSTPGGFGGDLSIETGTVTDTDIAGNTEPTTKEGIVISQEYRPEDFQAVATIDTSDVMAADKSVPYDSSQLILADSASPVAEFMKNTRDSRWTLVLITVLSLIFLIWWFFPIRRRKKDDEEEN